MSKRTKQINVRVEDDVLKAIERVRIIVRPSPSVAAIVRQAIFDYVEKMERADARDQRGRL